MSARETIYINVLLPGFVTGKENNFIEKLRFVTVVGGKAIDPINFELVFDAKVSEATMVLDSKVKPNPGATSKSYLQP